MQWLWFEQALLRGGWARQVQVAIEGGRFVSVEAGAAPHPQAERHAAAVPGMPNLHSHAFQRAAAGRTERAGADGDSFWTWRVEIYRLAAQLTPDAAGAIAALAYAEMLEAGFTHVGEFHYLHHQPGGAAYANPSEMADQILQAATEVGLDITLLPVFYAHSGFGGAPPQPEQARFVCDLDLYARLLEACRLSSANLPGVSVGVAPHSLRAVTPAELAAICALGRGGPIHIHVAEQQAEVAQAKVALGARPVEWLLDACEVDSRWCLVHATHITATERRRLARSGAVAGLCPITEANLGDGLFPAVAYARDGGAWGVGSDSNVFIDLAAELRLLEYGQRLTRRARNVMAPAGQSSGGSLFRAGLAGGGRALTGAASQIAPGDPATLVSLDVGALAPLGGEGDELLDAWMFAARRSPIDRVWTRGRLVVQDGRHLQRPRIEAAYRARMKILAIRGGAI